jgi:hypothetical protein
VLNGFVVYRETMGEQMTPKRMAWKNGEDLLFDDGFPHYVQNRSNKSRAILFADIPRIDVHWSVQWILRMFYLHALPLTEHWTRDMATQSKGLHRAFYDLTMKADLGPEGFEFHHPIEEIPNLIVLVGIPLMVGCVLLYRRRDQIKGALFKRCGPTKSCEDMVKKSVKSALYAKQA